MTAWGSAASVIAALRDEAAAEIERLEREADAVIARLRVADGAIALPDPAPKLAAARRAVADLDADEDWEDTVAAAAEREAWIVSVAEQGRRAIATAPDVMEWTAARCDEAIRQLPGASCVVALPAALLERADDAWRRALEQQTGHAIVFEAGPFPAGCVARTPDGKISFDNRIDAREIRAVGEWRAAIARLYETAVAPAEELAPA